VRLALATGFTAIDTANQRRHYHEVAVGEGIADHLAATGAGPETLFIQTKFTARDGQDHRLPYDPRADVPTQVEQSFASSLEHLRVGRVDSYVLHGPSSATTLTDEDWQAWGAMEALGAAGKAGALGVSNVTRGQLELLLAHAKMKPAFVQNRCYARRRWDAGVRAVCAAHGIRYQGFSLLTANPEVTRHPTTRVIATRLGATPAQVVFAFALAAGMLPLTGTTQTGHMKEDLQAAALVLAPDDVVALETLSSG
jgi:diketogulonate reductase-like aldo/keto reductase